MTNKLTLPIVLGKEYVRRDGKIIEARAAHRDMIDGLAYVGDEAKCPKNDGPRCVFLKNGLIHHGGQYKSDFDLVVDHIEPATQGHPHAALMALYAQDAVETAEPWARWEFSEADSDWHICGKHPEWRPEMLYRRKPRTRTISINGHEVPEPLREAPEINTTVWQVESLIEDCAELDVWMGTVADRLRLTRGLLHLTREAAQAHVKALLSFTEVKP